MRVTRDPRGFVSEASGAGDAGRGTFIVVAGGGSAPALRGSGCSLHPLRLLSKPPSPAPARKAGSDLSSVPSSQKAVRGY